jgi:hypothetical protein
MNSKTSLDIPNCLKRTLGNSHGRPAFTGFLLPNFREDRRLFDSSGESDLEANMPFDDGRGVRSEGVSTKRQRSADGTTKEQRREGRAGCN